MAELDDMRAFVAVAESGSFSQAGHQLGLSKSIVSRRVAGLEESLGARLLDRTTRGVRVTEAGEEFKLRAERILVELEAAREALAERGGEVVGRLRVAAPLTFGLDHVAPLLAELAVRHPRLRIEAAYGDRRVDLIADGFDAAVRLARLPDSSLIARKIAPIYGVAVASPAYLDRRGRPQHPNDLVRHDCLIQTAHGLGEPWSFQHGRRIYQVKVEGRFSADNGAALLAAAIAGLGIAMLPTFLASDAIGDGRLEALLPDHPMPEAGLYLVRPPGGHVPAKIRALTDILVERFGGQPYWDGCLMGGHAPARA